MVSQSKKNVSPDRSEGWTVVLMDRASRLIWSLGCGRKDRQRFQRAIRTLSRVVTHTRDLTLITDGETRDSTLLFEICHELLRNGKRGRPKKTLCKGVKVRRTNKGIQAHKRGRQRPKEQAPHPEHPDTPQTLENQEIHADHLEAFNASLRRRCAAFRRRTNTYAKKPTRLQQRLDVYWILHNFVRVHFTTRNVPAVALGIVEKGLSLKQIFSIHF